MTNQILEKVLWVPISGAVCPVCGTGSLLGVVLSSVIFVLLRLSCVDGLGYQISGGSFLNSAWMFSFNHDKAH
jgi:hypothetical protein